MNKKNLEILGLAEGATKGDIQAAYDKLREKYLEERFEEGEKGNAAAKMLTKIETAYNELMAEIDEKGGAKSGDGTLARIEAYIKSGDLQEAQRLLDGFNERGGQWHYLQSVLFYRKNWINESKKQLEIAINLEPDNEKYKTTYKKLNDKIQYDASGARASQPRQTYQGQGMNSEPDNQMGGSFCAQCIQCCYLNLCLNCLCNSCCR